MATASPAQRRSPGPRHRIILVQEMLKENVDVRINPYNPTGPSHGTAAGGPGGLQSPDFQQLVALLGNLMPLLLRFQLRSSRPFRKA